MSKLRSLNDLKNRPTQFKVVSYCAAEWRSSVLTTTAFISGPYLARGTRLSPVWKRQSRLIACGFAVI